MPEQVQKERTHWDAEPTIVGGKTKYPLYRAPEVSPVRDTKPFEAAQYGQSREEQQKAQEQQFREQAQAQQSQRRYRSDFRSEEKWDIEERRPQASWKVPGAPAEETQRYEAPQAPQQ